MEAFDLDLVLNVHFLKMDDYQLLTHFWKDLAYAFYETFYGTILIKIIQ